MGLWCRWFLCAICVLALSSAPRAMPRVYLHLTFQPDNFVQTSMKAAATAEAARIWSDYGVAIESDAQPAFCDAGTERLLIVLGGASDVGKGQDSLGAIHFAPDGTSDS